MTPFEFTRHDRPQAYRFGSVLLGLLLCMSAVLPTSVSAAEWRSIAPGMELRQWTATTPSPVGDAQITVLRIDPARWELDIVGRSSTGTPTVQTARQWADAHDLAVVTNAGMFATDYDTHVGYMECRGHVNSSRVNHYQSVAAFHPRDPETLPLFQIFDLDAPGVSMEDIRGNYASVVQNLRLIKKPGENRWSRQNKKWSEAALGEDAEGRILFVFSRSPFSMRDLNHELLAAEIGLVALQHLEGGPEAQLYVKAGDFELEIFGSFETSFKEDDGNGIAWPIPNVLGVRSRTE